MQAIRSTRPGGSIGYVGVPHNVELNGQELFFAHARLHGGPAPVHRYLPDLTRQVWAKEDQSGKSIRFDIPTD